MDDKAAKVQEQLQAMRALYAAQLPDKIRQIEETWEGLQQDWNDEDFKAMHRLVHGLTGSGATFGFSMLSEAARSLEILVKGLIAKGDGAPDDGQRSRLALCIEALGEASRNADSCRSVDVAAPVATSFCDPGNRVIFLVDDDALFAENLALQIGYFGYPIRVFSTLGEAYRNIIQSPPAVLLLDIDFPEDSMGGFNLLEQINREIGHVLPTFFISVHGELEYRLKAVRAGARAYFAKPLNVAALIDKLEELTLCQREEPYRILIVDDSRALAETYAASLTQAGMESQIVTDPLAVLEPLLEFAPDLVLMDVYMPQCSGLELASIIRQQERFVGIPIVFLSVETDMDKQLDAMNLGGDDFLTKPIQPEHLVSALKSRVRRARVLRSLMARDSLTGLLNHTAIKTQFDIQLARVKRSGGKLAFAMIDIDHFKSVNDTHGHPTGDRVIRSLSRLLQQHLRASDVVGRYGGEEFAVILDDADGNTAFQVLDKIRQDFAKIRHQSEQGDFFVTISIGIAEYPSRRVESTVLGEIADRALYDAKRGGRNRVVLATAE